MRGVAYANSAEGKALLVHGASRSIVTLTTACGTKPPNRNVGSSAAVGAKPDMTQPGLPSRSHAIRELVIQALDAAEAKNDKKPDKAKSTPKA
jgi:hypothetical protein